MMKDFTCQKHVHNPCNIKKKKLSNTTDVFDLARVSFWSWVYKSNCLSFTQYQVMEMNKERKVKTVTIKQLRRERTCTTYIETKRQDGIAE